MKILIVAGGTGGHFYPGVTLAEELKEEHDIIFVCSEREKEIIKKYKFQIVEIISAIRFKLQELNVIKFLISLFVSFKLIKKYYPDLIIGTGGYLSVPVIIVGFLFRIPIFLHEQNLIPGRANKLLSLFAKKIFVSFEETKKYFNKKKVIVSGNPIRKVNDIGLEKFSLEEEKTTILVFGGSTGAKKINEVLKETLKFLNNHELQILHVTGYSNYDTDTVNFNKLKYVKVPYIDELPSIMKKVDLVIARSGATTCYELIYLKKPAILIPYPYAVNKHQYYNAKYLEENGTAIIIKDDELTPDRLTEAIFDIILNKEKLNKMTEAIMNIPFYNAQEIIKKEVRKIR